MKSKIKKKSGIITLLTLLLLVVNISPSQARIEDGGGGSPIEQDAEPKVFSADSSQTQWYSSFLEKNPQAKSTYKPTIALIGDGLDESFSDFKGRVLTGYNFVEKRALKKKEFTGFGAGGYYGTSLASLLISNQNKEFLTGIAQNSRILPLVVTTKSNASDDLISQAVRYAEKKRVDYIVFALGIDQYLIGTDAKKTCQAIESARKSNILTFVDVVNSSAVIKYTFKLSDCAGALKVGSYDASLSQLAESVPEVEPDFSMPAGNISAIYSDGSYLPYMVIDDSSVSPILAAGLFSNFTSSATQSKESILSRLKKNALKLSSKDYYGEGIFYNYENKKSLVDIKREITKRYAPKIVSIVRDNDNYSLTWEPTLETPEFYIVNSYKFTKNTWVKSEMKVDPKEIRALVSGFDIYSKAFTQVTAVFKSYKLNSIPSFDASPSIKQPVHQLPESEATITSSKVSWSEEGINVTVTRNDKSYSWDLLVIDPYTGDILKKYSTSDPDSRTISVDARSSLRSKVLLIATGIGRNGIDYILMPDYLLTIKANAAGKDHAAFSGGRVCQDLEKIKCDLNSVLEGEVVVVSDESTGVELGRSRIASDGSYYILLPYNYKDYDVRARTLSGAKSIRLEGSFLFR